MESQEAQSRVDDHRVLPASYQLPAVPFEGIDRQIVKLICLKDFCN